MSNLDYPTKSKLMDYMRDMIEGMVFVYIRHGGSDHDSYLDMEEFGILKKTFDAFCQDQPLDKECKVYVKTLAENNIYEAIERLRELADDNPTLAKEVDELITWYQIARDI